MHTHHLISIFLGSGQTQRNWYGLDFARAVDQRLDVALMPDMDVNLELCEDYHSIDEWKNYIQKNPFVMDRKRIDALGEAILSEGFVEPLTGFKVDSAEIRNLPDNWREGLIFKQVNSRMRAVMHQVDAFLEFGPGLMGPRIYAAEGLTGFALRLRGIYPRFIGSEYSDDPATRDSMFPIPFEDLQNLNYPENTFDLACTNEVLEHVPSIDDAMRELYRVLKPGGWHLGTCPFALMDYQSIRRAELIEGSIRHLKEPEYHGNPMSSGGSLVFEIPGWNILDRLKKIGFRDAFMRFVCSKKHGFLSNHCLGIFVLCCQK